jgi:hypothetical protein
MEIPMKPVLQLLAASALSAGMMIGGVVLASAALAPEEDPHRFTGLDIKDLWTAEPVRIDRAAQNLERLPPRYPSHVVMHDPEQPDTDAAPQVATAELGSRVADIDIMSTNAVSDEVEDEPAPAFAPQHVSWCLDRYRSYDPIDNTYRSFSGELRDCNSPFLMEDSAAIGEGEAELITVSNGPESADAYALEDDHISGCMQRYRSYRPSDNSYQPYGGGPRRQCQLTSF